MSVPAHILRFGRTHRLTRLTTTSSPRVTRPPPYPFTITSTKYNRHDSGDFCPRRFFADESRKRYPTDLMDYPRIVPNIFSAIVNFVRSKFFEMYIKNRYDAEFSTDEFRRGAKAAFVVVSNILASDEAQPLRENGLVDSKAFEEIHANHKLMDAKRRRQFLVNEESIRATHLHQIGIIEDDATGQKAVEIMMVFYVMDVAEDELIEMPLKDALQKLIENTTLCNYRFHRDYTVENNPSPWILNVVNHFSLQQLAESISNN